MTIQYCSDLHLEFKANREHLQEYPPEPVGDILLLAGDITTLGSISQRAPFFNYFSDHFEQTYWVPGNHEYYQGDLKGYTGSLQENIRPNVTLLNNTVIDTGAAELICSTLWSAIHPRDAWRIEASMNDFYQIRDNGKRFTTTRYQDMYLESLAFISGALEQPGTKPRIVMTHHLPTFRNYPPQYLGDVLNQAFASDLDGLIQALQPDYWIFGHHHYNLPSFSIGNTQLLTNQLGYVDQKEHHHFDPERCLALSRV